MPTDNIYLRGILGKFTTGSGLGGSPDDTNNVLLRKILEAIIAAGSGGGSGGSGATIAKVLGLIKGDGAGNGIAATEGTDFLSLLTGLQKHAITFTPTDASWYRVLDETLVGGQIGGLVRLSGLDASSNPWSALLAFSGHGSAGSFDTVTQLYCTGTHFASAIRITGNGANHSALDVLTSAAGKAITVELMAIPLANPITVPAGGTASLGTSETQFFINAAGLRTSANIIQGSVSNGIVKASSGELMTAVGGTDYGQLVAVPGSAAAAGTPGQFAVAAGFIYFCVATNTWQRVVATTF